MCSIFEIVKTLEHDDPEVENSFCLKTVSFAVLNRIKQ